MNHFCECRGPPPPLLLCNLIILYVLTSFMNLMQVESVAFTFYFKENLRKKLKMQTEFLSSMWESWLLNVLPSTLLN